VAWTAIEGLYRQWACELGPSGIRIAWLRTGGFAESILGASRYESVYMVQEGKLVSLAELSEQGRSTAGEQQEGMPAEEEVRALADTTLLRRLPSLDDAGAIATFLASDRARSITATAVNVTSGAVVD
jgi:3-oxoacyl-[acyl-carrier protein] reductase